MIYLGIDPGIADMEYGFVDSRGGRDRCIAYGSIKTPAGASMDARLEQLHRELDALIKRYRPVAVGIEKLYFSKNVKTAFMVAEARGVIRVCVAQNGLRCHELNPSDVKIAVCGYGGADKGQVQRMVKTLLGLEAIPKPDDAADALAVAIATVHAQR